MPAIQILPQVTTLGCIPVGYIYSIKIKVTNLSPYPEKLKISCTQPDNEPNIIKLSYLPVCLAPGMSKLVQLELHATAEKTSKYELHILQETRGKIVKDLTFFVVDTLQYRNVSNKLSMVDKRAYDECVSIVGKVQCGEEPSLSNKSQTFSTALIADDEMEEISTMPLVKNVYWDPKAQMLIMDPELCKIFVNDGLTIEQSKTKTENNRDSRLDALESIGMVTCNSMQHEVSKVNEGTELKLLV